MSKVSMEDMLKAIDDYCELYYDEYGDGDCCESCGIASICTDCLGHFKMYPEAAKEAYNIIHDETKDVDNVDMVNHPPHYNREGAMETIDEMILVFGVEIVKAYCLCNVWKYRARATHKNGEEDLKKSDWYLKKYKELKECQNKNVKSSMNLLP